MNNQSRISDEIRHADSLTLRAATVTLGGISKLNPVPSPLIEAGRVVTAWLLRWVWTGRTDAIGMEKSVITHLRICRNKLIGQWANEFGIQTRDDIFKAEQICDQAIYTLQAIGHAPPTSQFLSWRFERATAALELLPEEQVSQEVR